jgi:hypothetical protein
MAQVRARSRSGARDESRRDDHRAVPDSRTASTRS